MIGRIDGKIGSDFTQLAKLKLVLLGGHQTCQVPTTLLRLRGCGNLRFWCRAHLFHSGHRLALVWKYEESGILRPDLHVFISDHPRIGVVAAVFDFDRETLQVVRLAHAKMYHHRILWVVNDEILHVAWMAVDGRLANRNPFISNGRAGYEEGKTQLVGGRRLEASAGRDGVGLLLRKIRNKIFRQVGIALHPHQVAGTVNEPVFGHAGQRSPGLNG